MSGADWAGPYCIAHGPAGEPLAWDPLGGARPPRGAARFVVRWRVTGFAHPRKRTFPDPAEAAAWARQIAAARLLRAPRDHRGWPLPATATPSGIGPGAAAPPGAGTGVIGEAPGTGVGPAAGGADEATAAGEPAGRDRHHAGTPLELRPHAAGLQERAAAADGDPQKAPAAFVAWADMHRHSETRNDTGAELGPDIAGFMAELIVAHRPHWEQTNQDREWLDQLRFADATLRYQPGDPRIATHGVAAGDSIHFRLLSHGDLNTALFLRRTTNLRNAHQNRQRRAAYQRRLAEYEAKLAAWQAREGHKGRKPVPPAEPAEAPETSDGQVLISENTERLFRTTLSFVFDRAFDAGMFPPGPNVYRQWNPRGTGGRHASRRSPFRTVPRHTAAERDYPGLGFWIDLGDMHAEQGRRGVGGVRSGERYRILPIVATQLAPRPEELRLLRDEHFRADLGTVLIENEDGHLKARERGQTRTTPLSQLVAALVAQHVKAGLAGPDGTLFLSPKGKAFDETNYYEKKLRPAIAQLCGEGKLWPEYPALTSATFYDTRKAGITTWIVYGADTYEASTWSGDTESELLRSYRGVHQKRGRRAIWKDIDHMVEQALLEDPPRGDGRLARHVRAWLDLS